MIRHISSRSSLRHRRGRPADNVGHSRRGVGLGLPDRRGRHRLEDINRQSGRCDAGRGKTRCSRHAGRRRNQPARQRRDGISNRVEHRLNVVADDGLDRGQEGHRQRADQAVDLCGQIGLKVLARLGDGLTDGGDRCDQAGTEGFQRGWYVPGAQRLDRAEHDRGDAAQGRAEPDRDRVGADHQVGDRGADVAQQTGDGGGDQRCGLADELSGDRIDKIGGKQSGDIGDDATEAEGLQQSDEIAVGDRECGQRELRDHGRRNRHGMGADRSDRRQYGRPDDRRGSQSCGQFRPNRDLHVYSPRPKTVAV